MTPSRLLLVEDDPGVRFAIRAYLAPRGYDVAEAATIQEAVETFLVHQPDAVLLDYQLHDGTTEELLRRFRQLDATVALIVLTAHGSIELAVRLMKDGAENFLTKPVELPVLLAVVERALEHRRTHQRLAATESRNARGLTDPFVGTSAAIRDVAAKANLIRGADKGVLILGETGVGKGVLAAWLHANGPRREEPFVDLNCAGLSRELLESELFGYEKGAFTGAMSTKVGLFEVADRGTMFLDEIGDMDTAVQPRVLKVLEDGRFRRLGSVQDRRANVRIIAATQQDLQRLVAEGRFRGDLYYRICGFPITVPPLRRRQEDIPFLARVILARVCNEMGRGHVDLTAAADEKLMAYSWPGNIRELRNVLERALLLRSEGSIRPSDLALEDTPALAPTADREDLGPLLTLHETERRQITLVLQHESGNVAAAAKTLGIQRSTLYHKLRRHGIAHKDVSNS